MIEFTCLTCGITRTGMRRRCYPCTVRQSPESREKIRQSLLGVRHSDERRRKNSEGHKGPGVNRFKLADFTRGKPSPRAKPVGTTRIGNGHIQVKCADGRWRYRARVMWAEAYGPINRAQLVHHINEDPFDDRLENFQLVTRSEHMRIHSTTEKMREKGAKGLATRYRH